MEETCSSEKTGGNKIQRTLDATDKIVFHTLIRQITQESVIPCWESIILKEIHVSLWLKASGYSHITATYP